MFVVDTSWQQIYAIDFNKNFSILLPIKASRAKISSYTIYLLDFTRFHFAPRIGQIEMFLSLMASVGYFLQFNVQFYQLKWHRFSSIYMGFYFNDISAEQEAVSDL